MINNFGEEQKKEEKNLPFQGEVSRRNDETKAPNILTDWMKDEFIKMAEEFNCCPICGTPCSGYKHYCEACKERYVTADDAYWFAEHLKKRWKGVKQEEVKKDEN